MSVYVDASVLVSLFTPDALSARVDELMRRTQAAIVISDFAAAEFASAISRCVRTRELAKNHARSVFGSFDEWSARETQRVEVTSADIAVTATYLRRLDLVLRAPDAIHIAIAQRIGARLMTLDKGMIKAARSLGAGLVAA